MDLDSKRVKDIRIPGMNPRQVKTFKDLKIYLAQAYQTALDIGALEWDNLNDREMRQVKSIVSRLREDIQIAYRGAAPSDPRWKTIEGKEIQDDYQIILSSIDPANLS